MREEQSDQLRRKPRARTLAITAGVVAVAMTVSGTLAFRSMTQKAQNKFEGFISNGTRLHDDYIKEINQKNNPKDVYVENFGKTPLIARIRVAEYFELEGKSQIDPHADKDDSDTWAIRKSGVLSPVALDWGWDMGGQKYYLPTENLDELNNGVYDASYGPDAMEADNIVGREYYDEADPATDLSIQGNVSVTDGPAGQFTIADPLTAADVGSIHTDNLFGFTDAVTGDVNYSQKTVRQTLDAEVITMAEWIAPVAQGGKNYATGAYWICDEDGWYYWGEYLLPETATGLLIHQVNMLRGMVTDYYYGIDIQLETVTISDAHLLRQHGLTTNAQSLVVLIDGAGGFTPWNLKLEAATIGTVFEDNSHTEWRVLDVSPKKQQILVVREKLFAPGNDAVTGQFHTAATANWGTSSMLTSLNSGDLWAKIDDSIKDFLPKEGVQIPYVGAVNGNTISTTAKIKVFLLGDFDIFGTAARAAEATTTVADGWAKGAPYFTDATSRVGKLETTDAATGYWTRSANVANTVNTVDYVSAAGALTVSAAIAATVYSGIRPAMILDFSTLPGELTTTP